MEQTRPPATGHSLSQEQDARGQFILCGASYSTNLNVYAHMHIHSNQSSSSNLGLVSRRIISKLAASIMMFLWNHGALKCSTMFYCVLFGSGIVLGIIFCLFCFFFGSPVLSVSVGICSILELEAAISTVFCNILEFEPLIFPSICNILVLELFMSHAFCN